MYRKRLFLEAPVGDYLPDDFKKKAKETSQRLYNDPQNPAQSSMEVGSLMMSLPRMEGNKKNQLKDLAIQTFYKLRPWVKNLVDKNKIELDVELGSFGGGRQRSQNISQSTIQKAKDIEPDFEEKI